MKDYFDLVISRSGHSFNFKLGMVLFVSGIALSIAYVTVTFAVGANNISEAGRMIMAILPWVSVGEIAVGIACVLRSK